MKASEIGTLSVVGPAPAELSSTGIADTLSDALEIVRLTGALFFLVEARAPWVAEAPNATHLLPVVLPRTGHIVSYHVVREGSCWCESPGLPPVRLEDGDVLVVPHGHGYRLSSDPGLRMGSPIEDTLDWFKAMAAGQLPFVVDEGGQGTQGLQLLCGFLGCDTVPFNPVLMMLPPLLRVRLRGDSSPRLNALLEFALAESNHARLGGRSVVLRLAELVFVEVLRSYVTSTSQPGVGWLAGLRDPVVGRALARLHAEPARPWTLSALARDVGVSRSVLAERFASFVGYPPMLYLTSWRMQLAATRLAAGAGPVSAVACDVGYESEAAFCRAFKKLTGVTPGSWRSARRSSVLDRSDRSRAAVSSVRA